MLYFKDCKEVHHKMTLLFQLYLSFAKIGFTSFGGMSMIPLILDEMSIHEWMTAEDLSNVIAIAEMTPGPLGMNCATFAGERTAGFLGGIFAVLGVLTPAFTLTLLTAICFSFFKKSSVFACILSVLKPICIVLMVMTIVQLSGENYFYSGQPDFFALGICIVMIYLIQRKHWKVSRIITLSAVIGIFCYGLMPQFL